METIERVIKFLSAYPAWAKLLVLGNIACVADVLVFAHVPVREAQEQQAGSSVLRINRVKLFPSSDQSEVQVSAFVNGIEFRYPSLAGVGWLRVGPEMSEQPYKLPKADIYELRFEMRKREYPGGNVVRLVSQKMEHLAKATSSTYALHGFEPAARSRTASVSAQII